MKQIDIKYRCTIAGMNTGIQDAHNLAWKIASVINGITPSSLLNTYEIERRPVLLLSFVTYLLIYIYAKTRQTN